MNKQNVFIVIAIAVIAFIAWGALHTTKTPTLGALSCGDGTATCLPALELTGALLSTNPAFQIDAGGMNITGATSLAALTVTGAATINNTSHNLTVTSTNSATSTLQVGCIQMNATSTATNIVLSFGTSFTGTTTLPTGVANSAGLVAWKFGSCPQ